VYGTQKDKQWGLKKGNTIIILGKNDLKMVRDDGHLCDHKHIKGGVNRNGIT
jgi:hypothetical protein